MRIFVTGGTGFIGRPTVQVLKKRGHQVLLLCNNSYESNEKDILQGDLSDVSLWRSKLKKFRPHAAVHLAWEAIPDFSYAQSVKNLRYGLALFDVLAEVGCKKIVVMGTGFECGNRVGKINDDTTSSPTNAFTGAKLSLHLMGEELAKERGMDFIWLRPFNPYGSGQRSESLIPYILRCINRETPLRLKDPLAQGDFIYVEDVAWAILSAVVKGRGRTTYNVGSGYLTPVRDIVRIICKETRMSKEYFEDFFRFARGRLKTAPYAGLRKVRRELGWYPKMNITTGIQKTIHYHYENNNNRI